MTIRCRRLSDHWRDLCSMLNGENDLAHFVAVLQITMGIGSFTQLEHTIDNRPDLSLLDGGP